jgi:putative NADPH-quinone reductase
MTEKTLLLVAHAPSPNTRALFDAAVAGACDPAINHVRVAAHSPFEVTAEMVLGADALLLGTPENLGYMSGALKDFFDRIYNPCLAHTQGKPFSYYIRAGHDGTGTKRAIQTITTGLRWRLVADPIICRGEFSEHFAPRCRELAMTLAVGLESGIF